MRAFFGIWMLLGLVACSSTPQSSSLSGLDQSDPLLPPVHLAGVPFFPQEQYQCGPAALAMLLSSNGVDTSPEALVPLVYVPALEGSLQIEMLAASRSFGRIAYPLPPTLKSVLREIRQGRPVLVMQNLGLSWYQRWHYAVVVGYDLLRGELVLHSGTRENYRVALTLFERTWRRADYWAMVVLQPGELPVDDNESGFFDALSALEHAQPDINVEPAYTAALQRWPRSTLLAMGLGNFYYGQGRKPEAAEQFTQLLEWSPGYAPAHNNLAQILLELGDLDAARQHAETAVALGGENLSTYNRTLSATAR